jgi:hypothetical protein
MRAISCKRLRETCQGAARGRADDALPPHPGTADGGAAARERDGGSGSHPQTERGFLQSIAKPQAWQSPPGAERACQTARPISPVQTRQIGSGDDPYDGAWPARWIDVIAQRFARARRRSRPRCRMAPAAMSCMPSTVVRARLLFGGDEVETGEVGHVRPR